jgi:hypothetical protein
MEDGRRMEADGRDGIGKTLILKTAEGAKSNPWKSFY